MCQPDSISSPNGQQPTHMHVDCRLMSIDTPQTGPLMDFAFASASPTTRQHCSAKACTLTHGKLSSARENWTARRCGVFCLLRFAREGFEAALSRQGGAHSSRRQARFPVTLRVRLMARGLNLNAWARMAAAAIARSRWHIEHQVPCSL